MDTRLQPLLTIAIPTYNRLDYLKELLPEILQQCKSHPEIEILVVDNNSTDGTFSYLHRLVIEGKIQYRCNETNVGGDENFVRCVEHSRGQYVWLFGDDDILLEGAVDIVMALLPNLPVSLVIVSDGTGDLKTHWYDNYAQFASDVSIQSVVNHTLITCNIFKKDMFDSQTARKYRSTWYGHMYALKNIIMGNFIVLTISNPIIVVRPVRAKFVEHVQFYRTNQLLYLYRMGIPLKKIIKHAYNLGYGTLQRRLGLP